VPDEAPPVRVFPPDELLYRSVRPEHWSADGLALRMAWIEFPKMSVYCASLGNASDAIDHEKRRSWGVVGFPAGDIPMSLKNAPTGNTPVRTFFFVLKHHPENGKESHCDILCLNEEGVEEAPGAAIVKSTFREALRRRAQAVIQPMGFTHPPLGPLFVA
jgi:hypothetical protein